MGRLFFKRAESDLRNVDRTRCLICNKLILLSDVLIHSKKCSKLFIENFNNNDFAKRFHIIHYTLNLDDDFAKNFLYDNEILLFLCKLYEDLFNIRENYPNQDWNRQNYNSQELIILDSIFYATTGFYIRFPPGLIEYMIAHSQNSE